MVRLILINVLMFALPFLIYGGYTWLVRGPRPAGAGGSGGLEWSEAPVFWLLGIGLAMVVATFLMLVSFEGADPDDIYIPSHYKDGKLIPGVHVKKKPPGSN